MGTRLSDPLSAVPAAEVEHKDALMVVALVWFQLLEWRAVACDSPDIIVYCQVEVLCRVVVERKT